MRTLLSNRKLLKRELVDIENHIRGALRAYGLLVGAVSRGRYEERVRELIERTDFVFSTMIETMLDVRRAIFDGYGRLHRCFYRWCSTIARSNQSTFDDGSRCRTRRGAIVQGRGG